MLSIPCLQVTFLNKTRLSHQGDGPKVAKRLVDVYFALFKVLLLVALLLLVQCDSYQEGCTCNFQMIFFFLLFWFYVFYLDVFPQLNLLFIINIVNLDPLIQVLISGAGNSHKDKESKDGKKSTSKDEAQFLSESHVELDSRLLSAILTVSNLKLDLCVTC